MSDTRVPDCPEEAFVKVKVVDHSLNKYSFSTQTVQINLAAMCTAEICEYQSHPKA